MSKKQIVIGLFGVYVLSVLVCFAVCAWVYSHFGLEFGRREILACFYVPISQIFFAVLLYMGVGWFVDRLSNRK